MSIAENIAQIEEQIAAACRRAVRSPESVRLMAVSKTHPPHAVLEAHAAGVRVFAENRVQEYAEKREVLQSAGIFGDGGASVHCIGHLQSNKVRRAVELFDAIDSVDSLAVAERLNHAATQTGKRLPVLIEVKVSEEDSKHGLRADSPELNRLLERMPDLQHLELRGLMTVPPFADDLEQVRPYFRSLRELRDSLIQRHPKFALEELSMGMSHDFSVAIEEGSTMVRVGTAIFGARPSR
ncbi:MAG TPA: YggS family pyridoxal phosphate-dependent enzyme [Acidobacteriaceae bacterium]|nr:YggS family pyridoxal phosphate-dependent enzyme [Acidobacteriaceae bacterium]